MSSARAYIGLTDKDGDFRKDFLIIRLISETEARLK